MQAAVLPAIAGWQWVFQGWQIFKQQPLAMLTWAMLISFLLMLATLVAPIGPLIFICLMPAITFVTLTICRHITEGHKILPNMWVNPLKAKGLFRKLLAIGSIYVVLCLIVGFLAFLPFIDELSSAMQTMADSKDLAPLIDAVQLPMMIFAGLYVILAALFWYAPVMVGWHGTSTVQALFFSAIACWRNKWAFLVYGVIWVCLFFAVDLFSSMLVTLGVSLEMAATLQVPLNITLGSVMYCSFYPSYVSVLSQHPNAEVIAN
jgi:hypothetical protein